MGTCACFLVIWVDFRRYFALPSSCRGGIGVLSLSRQLSGRPENQHRDADEQGGGGQTDGVDVHNSGKCPGQREDAEDPEDTHPADTQDDQQGGHQGDAKAAEVAGHDLVEHTKDVGSKDDEQSRIADVDDLGVWVEQRQNEFSGKENDKNGGRSGNGIL